MKCLKILMCMLLGSMPRVTMAQHAVVKSNNIYQYGVTRSFLGGLFKGDMPLSEFKKHGNFGIAAPDLLDGELIMKNGRIYQTRADGTTRLAADTAKIPLGFACFFRPTRSFTVSAGASLAELNKAIDQQLTNKNAIYAVRVTGNFKLLKTRACHPVKKEPYPSITQVFAEEKVFELKETKGSMIGFRMPLYLECLDLVGYHFHYLSDDLKSGGHVLDVSAGQLFVEIQELTGLELNIPKDEKFATAQFGN